MNVPLSLSTQVPNNAWMGDMSLSEREVRLDKAVAQFHELYRYIAQQAIVYLLPSNPGLQDQPYVSNLGAVLPHRDDDTVLISRFRAKARAGEAKIGANFFRLMNFAVEQVPRMIDERPAYFEGEADLKHMRGNLYICAYGMRTSRNALDWMAERFEMNILPFRITDPYLYHLDCSIFRVSEEAVLLCTSVADRADLREIERHCEIIDVSREEARAGITNGLLLQDEILCDSDIFQTGKGSQNYTIEKHKTKHLEQICSRFGYSLRIFCVSEFYKSGALLSCLIMPIKQVVKLGSRMQPS